MADDEECYGSEYGHAAVYHSVLVSQSSGWYEESPEDEHVASEEEGEDGVASPPSARAHSSAVPRPPALNTQDSKRSLYGTDILLPSDKAASLVPPGEGGLVWHAQVLADDYQPKAKDTLPDGTLKPRRPLPHVRASDFFSSLVKTADGRYIFTGTLNGWPALTGLEVRSITLKVRKALGAPAIKRLWNAGEPENHEGAPPSFPAAHGRRRITGVRVTLRAAPWSAVGWSAASRGFVFWFRLGGYGGKSNWYDDRDDARTALYASMPPALKLPWRSNLAEVRVLDVQAADKPSFEAYLTKYAGPTKRFLDPTIVESCDVKLSHRTRSDLLTYLLNYVAHQTAYDERTRNCQTFACDLYALLSGRHGHLEPVTTLLRPLYKPHLEWFLCDPPSAQ